jgi:peptide/nickel transport system substrate-binding protein
MAQTGTAAFVPNPTYTGPSRAVVSSFTEMAFTSGSQELGALRNGTLDVGYLPTPQDAGSAAIGGSAGSNDPSLAGTFTLAPLYTDSINFAAYDYATAAQHGALAAAFGQLYVRQALQELVNQPSLIASVFHGYAQPTYGPVPDTERPHSSFRERASNPYPYDPAAATLLLRHHGWSVQPGHAAVCTLAGTAASDCGAGIPAGTALRVNFQYPRGDALVHSLLRTETAAWDRAGIRVSLKAVPLSSIGALTRSCSTECRWDLGMWGDGWLYSPDHDPTGEDLFSSVAATNVGGFANADVDTAIGHVLADQSTLGRDAETIARDLPVLFQPSPAASLTEIRDGLRGVTPQNPYDALTPESWRWG